MKVNTNTSVSVQSTYTAVETTPKQEEKRVATMNKETARETARETTRETEREGTKEERAKVKEFVDKINKELEHSDTKLQFRVHESEYSKNNKISITVIDESNNRVIAEIPSEEAIEFAEKMHELTGVLFDQRN